MTDYNYAECGLDNVVIKGMQVVMDDAGEEVYRIPNITGLHRCIAHCIIVGEQGITPKELRFLRTEMGITQAELSEIVRRDAQTVGRWERGDCPIDGAAELVIRIAAAEKLSLDPELPVEELAKRCIPSAEFRQIIIDGSDSTDYRRAA